MDLLNELNMLTNQLSEAIKIMARYGKEKAEAEKNYKIALRQEALILRSEKDMAVTLIDKVVYGVSDVADKRFKRDVAEAVYQANQEAINSIKLQIRVIENQLSREWSSTK